MALSERFRLVLPLVVMLLLTAVGVRTFLHSAPVPRGTAATPPTIVYIKPKTSVQEIARTLQGAGIIKSSWAFLALAYLQGSPSCMIRGSP